MRTLAVLCLVGGLLTGCAAGPAGPAPAAQNLAAPAAAPAGASYARRLMVRRCQNCHALPNTLKYDTAAWQRRLDQMKKKVRLAQADWDSLAALVAPARAVDTADTGRR